MRVTYAKCYADNRERIHGPFPSLEKATAYVLEHYANLRFKFYYVTEDSEAAPKIQDFECKNCESITEGWDTPQKCVACGCSEFEKLLPMPSLYGLEGSASFLDGTKRKGFADLKEASKLEVKMADMPHAQRGSIQKEITKLKASK